MMTPLEIKGAMAAVITSVVILVATFIAGGIYRNRYTTETQPGTKALASENLGSQSAKFFPSKCAHCHGRDADGGEDAPSLLKLQI
jgi:cytochrome c553